MSNTSCSTVTIKYVWKVDLSIITPVTTPSGNEDKSRSTPSSSHDGAGSIKSPVFAGGWQLECSSILIDFIKNFRLDVKRCQPSSSAKSIGTLVSANISNEQGSVFISMNPNAECKNLSGWEKAALAPWSTVRCSLTGCANIIVEIRENLRSSCIENLIQENTSLETKLRYFSQVFTDPSGMDVIFVFPNGKKLAASRKLLSEASEYFRSMFRSGCIEGVSTNETIIKNPNPTTVTKPNKAGDEFVVDEKSSSSEDQSSTSIAKSTEVETVDTQTTLVDNDPDSDVEDMLSEGKEETSTKSCTEVPIKNCQYKTFRTMLLYLMTGVIKFAPLRSTYRAKAHTFSGKDPELEYEGSIATVSGMEAKEYQERLSDNNGASPKSVFVLADIYQMEGLKKCALLGFEEGLTPENSIYELFTDCSEMYEPIRSIIVKFVLANWGMVRMTPAMENVISYAGRAGPNQAQAWKTIMGRLSVADPLT